MNLAKNIKLIREKNNLTQEEFGRLVGVTRSAVSKWERGISDPPIDSIKDIADFFKVSVDELTGVSTLIENTYITNIKEAKVNIRNQHILSRKNKIVFIVPIINVVLSLLVITSLLVVLVNAYIEYNNQDTNTKLVYANIESVSLKIYYPDKGIEDIKMEKASFNQGYLLENINIININKHEKALRTHFSVIVEFKNGYFSDLSRTYQLTVKECNFVFQESLLVYPYFVNSGTYSFIFYIENEMGYLEASYLNN